MFTKIIIIFVMLFILFALGSSLVFLVRDPAQSKRVVKALTWRIGLSLILFIFLMLSFHFRWLVPHSM